VYSPGGQHAPSTIADVLFPAEDVRLILAVERELARDSLATVALTRIIADTEDRDGIEREIHWLAESLDWRVGVENQGSTRRLTVGRA
jgi:hypothetical protein